MPVRVGATGSLSRSNSLSSLSGFKIVVFSALDKIDFTNQGSKRLQKFAGSLSLCDCESGSRLRPALVILLSIDDIAVYHQDVRLEGRNAPRHVLPAPQ